MEYLKTLGLLTLVAAFAACSNDAPPPTAPAAPPASTATTATLKVTAPTPSSPTNNVEFPKGQRSTALEAQAARGEFTEIVAPHRFELWEGDNMVQTQVVATSGGRATMNTGDLRFRTAYRWRVRAESNEGAGPWSGFAEFRTGAPVQPRRDPGFPASAVRAEAAAVAGRIAAQFPGALGNSCQEHGGSWEFLDRVVDALRESDNRWGYNGKRGNPNDPSMDVIDYHWGGGLSEGSTQVYILDIIGGHCGPSPSVSINDVTDVTLRSGTVGLWITRGRFVNEY